MDRDETWIDEEDEGYIDLGGLIVKKGAQGLWLRLQVEDQEGTIAAVMLAGPDSGLELRAFAAPRSGGIWDEVRTDTRPRPPAVAAPPSRPTASSVPSCSWPFQCSCCRTARRPPSRAGSSASRGPRWLLRGTFLGRSAQQPDPDGPLESAFRGVIVVRGDEPMAPRDAIRTRMPAQAQAQLMAEQQDPDAGR